MRYVIALLLFVSPSLAEPRITFVSREKQAAALSFIPDSTDNRLQELRGRAAYYTEKEIPRAHQGADDATFHSAYYNIAGNLDKFGNGNREFPWDGPSGLRLSNNAQGFRFVVFPERDAIATWADRSMTRWTYPAGTTFIEALTVNSTKNYLHTFEVRTRTKQTDGKWTINVYRPFGSAWELELAAQEYEPGWSLGDDKRNYVYHLADEHPVRTIDRKAYLQHLPPMKEATVQALLSMPFKQVTGKVWASSPKGVEGYAGTADGFHVFPQKYEGAFLEMTNKACMTCHSSTLQPVSAFQQSREWYGRIRGDDAIFTFHPIDPTAVSDNGISKQARFRKDLLEAGLIK